MDNVTRIRRKTTANTILLPNEVIADAVEQNLIGGVLDFNAAVADVFDYMASVIDDGADVRSFSRGQVGVVYAQSYRDQAAFYRAISVAGSGGGGVGIGKLTRNDWATKTPTQYGGAVYVQPPD